MGVSWKKGRRALENEPGHLLHVHRDPLQPVGPTTKQGLRATLDGSLEWSGVGEYTG